MLGCSGFDKPLGGIEACPSAEDVRLGCGVVGRCPRGGERGAAAGPTPGFRLGQAAPKPLLISARRACS